MCHACCAACRWKAPVRAQVQAAGFTISPLLPRYSGGYCRALRAACWACSWLQAGQALGHLGLLQPKCSGVLPAAAAAAAAAAPAAAVCRRRPLPGVPGDSCHAA
jgi:hypothetical protein